MTTAPTGIRPGLLRRLAALAYDTLLLMGIELIAAMWLPLVPESFRMSQTGRALILGWVLLVAFVFLGYCWTHGGQTLGMRAWKIRVQREDGQSLRWFDSVKRYGASLVSWLALGLGFLWVAIDRERRAWHDTLSGTRISFDERYVIKQRDAA